MKHEQVTAAIGAKQAHGTRPLCGNCCCLPPTVAEPADADATLNPFTCTPNIRSLSDFFLSDMLTG